MLLQSKVIYKHKLGQQPRKIHLFKEFTDNRFTSTSVFNSYIGTNDFV